MQSKSGEQVSCTAEDVQPEVVPWSEVKPCRAEGVQGSEVEPCRGASEGMKDADVECVYFISI